MLLRVTLEAESEEKLQEKIDDYMQDYHPAGYGTWIDSKSQKDGKFIAVVKRYDSCD